jgi:putative ABC transport system substrate-binding protein
MRRRDFITLCGGGAVATALSPLLARAQEPGRVYRLGFAIPVGRDTPAIVAFFDELRMYGFVEGQNLTVVPDGFDVRNDRLAEQAAAVVKAAPDAIVSGPDNYTRVYQQLTSTIPLVAMTEDMVAAGLVASLARPGGNTTGISLLSPELDGKRQGLLIEAVPGVRRMAALADSTVTPPRHLQELQDAARTRGVELLVFGVARSEEVVPAVDKAKAGGAEAINFLATPLFTINPRVLLDHVVASRLPAIHQWPELAEEGGLLGYGPGFTQVFRQRARLVAKVLRGAKPADLPVEQPTRFELVINLKTAKAIGHEVPAGLVLRADKVIE